MMRWQVLADLVNRHGWTRGVELGVFRGETFKHVLLTCPNLDLTGVDLFDTAYYQSTRVGRPPKSFDLQREYEELQHWLVNEGLIKRGRLLRTTTQEAVDLFEDGSLDFVFIDADHRYEAVRLDIQLWAPKVRAGGWLLGHDYNEAEFPGVCRAVREVFGPVGAREGTVPHGAEDPYFWLFDDHVWGAEL